MQFKETFAINLLDKPGHRIVNLDHVSYIFLKSFEAALLKVEIIPRDLHQVLHLLDLCLVSLIVIEAFFFKFVPITPVVLLPLIDKFV